MGSSQDVPRRAKARWSDADPATKKVFYSIGSALSAFTMMEHELLLLYLAAGWPEGRPPGAADGFLAVPDFAARLRIAGAVLNAAPARDLRDRWRKIEGRLEKLGAMRAKLAHGATGTFGDPSGGDPKAYWIPFADFSALVLAASPGGAGAVAAGRAEKLDAAEIEACEDAFSEMFRDLQSLREGLSPKPASTGPRLS